MFLREFFGKSVDINKMMAKNKDDNTMNNDLFWFIIDHDKLHKDFFHPVATKIHKAHKNNTLDKEEITKEFMPMVKKGCKEFYHHNKLPGHFENNFDTELMKEMCERLYDHYREDITSGKHYEIGA